MVNGEWYEMLFAIRYTLYVKDQPITRSDFRLLTLNFELLASDL